MLIERHLTEHKLIEASEDVETAFEGLDGAIRNIEDPTPTEMAVISWMERLLGAVTSAMGAVEVADPASIEAIARRVADRVIP